MLVLKQTIPRTKALLFGFHREVIKKIIQRGILQSLRIQVLRRKSCVGFLFT